MANALILEDEENVRFSMARALSRAGHEVREADGLASARRAYEDQDFDLIITDVNLGGATGLDFVRSVRDDGYDGVVLVVTAFGSVENAVEAMRLGADDYLQKPISVEQLLLSADRWLSRKRDARRLALYERLEARREIDDEILGESERWRDTMRLAKRLAGALDATEGQKAPHGGLPCILLQGETGVGKGALARYIHDAGLQRRGSGDDAEGRSEAEPFIHVNCSALAPTLVEAELFGHERGAFTDAREARSGLFEMAEGGTIFLDEVAETSLEFQSKLLIVLEQGRFRRVGGAKERKVRARVIAATNQRLLERVENGTFRQDLLYRLNAFTINIPPLRERDDDAVLIAEHLADRFSRQFGRSGLELSDEAKDAIRQHVWPGNIRELINAVQRGAMLAEGTRIEADDLAIDPAMAFRPAATIVHNGAADHAINNGHDEPVEEDAALHFDFENGPHTAEDVERALIKQAIEKTRGNVSSAARLIVMQRSSLRYRIQRYGFADFIAEVAKR